MIEVELIKPHTQQREIVELFHQEDTFLLTVICGRQFGKTTIGENIALQVALNESNQNIMWVSPTDQQAKKVYNEVYNSIAGTIILKSKKGSSGQMELVFINGSKIQFRGALSGDNLRGDSLHYLFLDEAAFMSREVVESVLLPSLSVTGKKILILTTPKGKNWIYEYYMKGLSDRERFKSLRYPSTRSPLMNKDLLDMFKQSFTEDMFKQEILAEFVDVGSVFRGIDDLAVLDSIFSPVVNGKYWAGIDVGLVNDATVVSIIDEPGDVVKYYRFVGRDVNELVLELNEIFDNWKFQSIFIEDNNQGLPLYQLLKLKYPELRRFNTNVRTKQEIIDDLIFAVNNKSIKFVNDELLKQELENFKFKQSSTGHLKYLAENGYTDDIVMSIAVARRCWKEKRDIRIEGYGFG